MPLDPWKHEYVYLCPGPSGEAFLIVSYGADGEQAEPAKTPDITSNDLN